jgi:hypothetical protein
MSAEDAFFRIVHAYPGGVAALAPRMGKNPNTLQHEANPNDPTHKPKLADAELVTGLTGDPQIAQAMALACGHICLPVAAGRRGELAAEIAAVGKEFGDVMQATLKALEDGKVTHRELGEFDKQFQEHLSAVIRLRGELVARIPQAPGALKVAK